MGRNSSSYSGNLTPQTRATGSSSIVEGLQELPKDDRRRVHVRDQSRGARSCHGAHHRLEPQGPAEALGLLHRKYGPKDNECLATNTVLWCNADAATGKARRHVINKTTGRHTTPSIRPTSRAGCSTSFGSSDRGRGGVRFFALETSLRYVRAHPDVHPRSDYEELCSATRDYAGRISPDRGQVWGRPNGLVRLRILRHADDCGTGSDRRPRQPRPHDGTSRPRTRRAQAPAPRRLPRLQYYRRPARTLRTTSRPPSGLRADLRSVRPY